MWIIIKSLLSISQQWFKGNTVKCVLVLHKWDLNVRYDFRQSIPIFVLLNPDIYANFFLFQLILRLLFICPHITDITEINPWAFPCGVFIFYKWENVITKIRLNWITGYCIVLLFEGLQLYCPHFACIISINLWALPRRVPTIYSGWENDVHLPFQSPPNLQMNRRPNINFWPIKLLLMSRKFTIRLMYILGLIFLLPGRSAHSEEEKSGFPRTDNYISIIPLVIRMRKW